MNKLFSAGIAVFLLFSLGLFGPAIAAPSGHSASSVKADVNGSRQALPPKLRPALYHALAKDASPSYYINKDGCASLVKPKLTACFNARGAHFSGAAKPLSLRLVGFGRTSLPQANKTRLTPIKPVKPEFEKNWVRYHYGPLTEWWVTLPGGYEQGFSIAQRPSGNGKLVLELSANDNAAQHDGELAWGQLRYGKLVVIDANGRIVPSLFRTRGNKVQIVVWDAKAVYPLTVDPLVWLEQKVAVSDGQPGASFGFTTAIFDTTALIGAPGTIVNGNASQGAAYVFTKSDGVWNETQKLTANDGAAGDAFGVSVALDGTTALIGAHLAPCDNSAGYCNPGPGMVYVFTESGDKWSQAQELTASDGQPFDLFGHEIALSGDTAFIQAQFAQFQGLVQGVVYVFNRSGNTWVQTQELKPESGSQGTFGTSIGFDGTTAIIAQPVGASGCVGGGECPPRPNGAAYVYAKKNRSWAQTQKLTVPKSETNNGFPSAIALEGNTALLGASVFFLNDKMENSAYVFTRTGGAWSQAQRLTASDGGPGIDDDFGAAVALDGNTAVVTAPFATVGDNISQGAAYMFSKTDGTWSQQFKLVASDGSYEDRFGQSVPISLDGDTMLIGCSSCVHGLSQGAAYFYTFSDLGLAVDAAGSVFPGATYSSQTLVTNNGSAASPEIAAIIPVPAAASFVSASASQGNCGFASGTVTCDFGSIAGNAGMATASLTLKAVHIAPGSIDNTASIAKASPDLSASTPTAIVAEATPVADDGSVTTAKNKSASGALKATSPEGHPLTFSIVSQPANGTVELTDASKGSYTYTPDKGFTGKDSFAFTASDGQTTSNVATVSVTVKNTSSGGGGGAFGWLGLVALLGLLAPALMRRKRA